MLRLFQCLVLRLFWEFFFCIWCSKTQRRRKWGFTTDRKIKQVQKVSDKRIGMKDRTLKWNYATGLDWPLCGGTDGCAERSGRPWFFACPSEACPSGRRAKRRRGSKFCIKAKGGKEKKLPVVKVKFSPAACFAWFWLFALYLPFAHLCASLRS